MKILLISALFAVILTGCGSSAYEPAEEAEAFVYGLTEESVHGPTGEPETLDYEPHETPEEYSPEPEVEHLTHTPQPAIPFDTASQFFSEIEDLFDRDNGELWGFKLHVPIIFACPATRNAVANMPDPNGILERYGNVYFGTLPEYVTIFDTVVNYDYFGGKRWVVVPWAAVQRGTRENRLNLLSHKAFHWHQYELWGLDMSWNNSHVNEMEARIHIRLEINALLRALRVTGERRYSAVHDALSIRAERRGMFDRAADENRLEMVEGLTQYTEVTLNRHTRSAQLAFMEGFAAGMAHGISLEHSFGYVSGALYAFLLNDTGVQWKNSINIDSDLGLILKEAMGISALMPLYEIDLTAYGYAQISQEELAWADARESTLRVITENTLNQPNLRFYHSDFEGLNLAFSGHRFSFYGLGMVFRGNIDYQGSFGRLLVQNGDFIVHDDGVNIIAALNIKVDGRYISGSNWELTLNAGYEVVPVGDNFVVVSSE